MDFLQSIHSIVRWAIVAVALIAVIKFAVGWLTKAAFKPMDRGLMSGFTGLMDLQLLLGLILLFGRGLIRYRLEHAFTMILAVALAHLAMRWRKSDNDALKFRNNLAVILGAMLLIVGGIMALPQGWFG